MELRQSHSHLPAKMDETLLFYQGMMRPDTCRKAALPALLKPAIICGSFAADELHPNPLR